MNEKFENMINIVERENNTKRNYLFVNRFQAKHVPVSPQKAITLFEELAEKVIADCKNKKTTVIGFAETATAIGSVLAVYCDVYYIHTSRENLNLNDIVVEFQEEHSHATEQILYCSQPEKMLFESEQIIFAEDEITTGKTILNFIEALQKKGVHAHFAACSIVNSMDKQHRDIFDEKNISLYSLLNWKKNVSDISFSYDTITVPKKGTQLPDIVQKMNITGKVNPRLGIAAKEYQKACMILAEQICKIISQKQIENLLILGTEECMYPAILTGAIIQKKGICKNVKTHSTTRSPIVARTQKDYIIFNKSSFESFYEKGRKTYLYNLTKYDAVIVLTDAQQYNEIAEKQILKALKAYGNNDVTIINWRQI